MPLIDVIGTPPHAVSQPVPAPAISPIMPAKPLKIGDTVLFQFTDHNERKDRSAVVLKVHNVLNAELLDLQVAFGPNDIHPSKPKSLVYNVPRFPIQPNANDATVDGWAPAPQ